MKDEEEKGVARKGGKERVKMGGSSSEVKINYESLSSGCSRTEEGEEMDGRMDEWVDGWMDG